jgi:hypothetical protein
MPRRCCFSLLLVDSSGFNSCSTNIPTSEKHSKGLGYMLPMIYINGLIATWVIVHAGYHPIWRQGVKRSMLAASPKRFGARRTKNHSQPHAPNALFVRRGPIRCLAPRARPRYTGDALGTPDTTKCEAWSGGTDASEIHERSIAALP